MSLTPTVDTIVSKFLAKAGVMKIKRTKIITKKRFMASCLH